MTDFTVLKLLDISDKKIIRKLVHFVDKEVYKIFLLALNFGSAWKTAELSQNLLYLHYLSLQKTKAQVVTENIVL